MASVFASRVSSSPLDIHDYWRVWEGHLCVFCMDWGDDGLRRESQHPPASCCWHLPHIFPELSGNSHTYDLMHHCPYLPVIYLFHSNSLKLASGAPELLGRDPSALSWGQWHPLPTCPKKGGFSWCPRSPWGARAALCPCGCREKPSLKPPLLIDVPAFPL